jgi:hypothetical protein
MGRIIAVLSLVALLGASAVPSIAQPVSQEFSERRIESGKASPSESVSNTGNNANLCVTTQQAVNTGNVANQQGVGQYRSEADDLDFTGSNITISPAEEGACEQTIRQSVAAAPAQAAAASAPTPAPAAAVAAPTQAQVAPAQAEAGGAQAKALPSTGGLPLLGLGAGGLLTGGGLLARKMLR